MTVLKFDFQVFGTHLVRGKVQKGEKGSFTLEGDGGEERETGKTLIRRLLPYNHRHLGCLQPARGLLPALQISMKISVRSSQSSPFFDPYLLQVIHWDPESPGTRLQAEFSTIHAFPSSRHQSHFSSLSFLFTFAQSRTSCWIKHQIGTFLNESKRSFNGATSCISLFGLPLSRASNATNPRKSFHLNS